MQHPLSLMIVLLFASAALTAQDSLPNFSVSTRDNKRVLISWYNPFKNITQISIQRSSDSNRNFKTLLSVPYPNAPENGFVDSKAPNAQQYYRLFISFGGGDYRFSPTKKTEWITSAPAIQTSPAEILPKNDPQPAPEVKPAPAPPTPIPGKMYILKKSDTILGSFTQAAMNRIRDSIRLKTRDTLVFRKGDTVLIKPYIPREVFKPSVYVFTGKGGNVYVNLPDTDRRKYSIQFFDEQHQFLFRISQVKESPLIIEKVNFLQSGWYLFELFEEGRLMEKNKFYIPRDF